MGVERQVVGQIGLGERAYEKARRGKAFDTSVYCLGAIPIAVRTVRRTITIMPFHDTGQAGAT